jgi:hypothetical protein
VQPGLALKRFLELSQEIASVALSPAVRELIDRIDRGENRLRARDRTDEVADRLPRELGGRVTRRPGLEKGKLVRVVGGQGCERKRNAEREASHRKKRELSAGEQRPDAGLQK